MSLKNQPHTTNDDLLRRWEQDINMNAVHYITVAVATHLQYVITHTSYPSTHLANLPLLEYQRWKNGKIETSMKYGMTMEFQTILKPNNQTIFLVLSGIPPISLQDKDS